MTDEIERWTHRRDMYLWRRTPEEVREAVRSASRIFYAQELARGAIHGMTNVHREANGIVHDHPGIEFAVRDLEAAYQAGCIRAVAKYMFR